VQNDVIGTDGGDVVGNSDGNGNDGGSDIATDGTGSDTITGNDSAGDASDNGFDTTPPPDAMDSIPPRDVRVDAPVIDIPLADGPLCGFGAGAMVCGPGTQCLNCSVGAMNTFSCVTPCATSTDCTDPARPNCVIGGCGIPRMHYCSAMTTGCFCGVCAAGNTPIATPSGERAISDLAVGDIVYGMRHEQLVPVRVLLASRTAVSHHSLIHVVLRNGRVLEMSAGHPTIDGAHFGTLVGGDDLGGAIVESTSIVAYDGSYTYDLLTDGDRGAYVAAGVLVGSTLWQGVAPSGM
jgi:hypothetical protein